MSSTYENSLLDFDLNLLNHTTSNTEQELLAKIARLRRSVILLKKKVLFSHSAVTKYKEARNYASKLENNQVFNKEGCKQHLIEIRNFIDKVSRLENESRIAENRDREKNEIISDLQNKNEGLQSLVNQLKSVLSEKIKTDSTATIDKKNNNVTERTRKSLVEKENEAIRKEKAKVAALEKENEILRRENAKISKLEKEIENLQRDNVPKSEEPKGYCGKENIKIKNLKVEIQRLVKENSQITNLKKEIETLSRENGRIPKLERDMESLRKENINLLSLKTEIETLRKDSKKMHRLEKEIENLRNENTKISMLENENEILRQESTKILSLKKEINTLYNKNGKTIVSGGENNNSKYTKKEIESLFKHLSSAIKDNSKLSPKYSELLRKCESDESDWSDADNDLFEEALSSPAPNNITQEISNVNMVAPESENAYDNKVVKEDTFRTIKTCVSSPDYYFNDKQSNIESNENMANMDNRFETTSIRIEIQDISESEDIYVSEKHSERFVDKIDAATSPIHMSMDVATDEIECQVSNNTSQCERHSDWEIQTILGTMKLNHKAVSPIPRSPSSMRDQASFSLTELKDQILRYMTLSETIQKLQKLVKRILYCCIKKHFDKPNLELRLHPDTGFLGDQYDGDHNFEKTMNHLTKLIACFENVLKTQELLNVDTTANTRYNRLGISETIECDSSDMPLLSENVIRTGDILNDEDSVANTNNFEVTEPILVEDDSNLPLMTNESSIENTMDIWQNEEGENELSQISLTVLQDENQTDLLNHCVSDVVTTDSGIHKDVSYPMSNIEIDQTPIDHLKKRKTKKVSKLERFKKKVEPKYKIKRDTGVLPKSRIKPKNLGPIEKKPTLNDTSASLNEKHVYEKAVKVMAEINSRQSNRKVKSSPKNVDSPLSPNVTTPLEKLVDSYDHSQTTEKGSKSSPRVMNSPLSPKVTNPSEPLINGNDHNQITEKGTKSSSRIMNSPLSPKVTSPLNKNIESNDNKQIDDKKSKSTPIIINTPLSPKVTTTSEKNIDNNDDIQITGNKTKSSPRTLKSPLSPQIMTHLDNLTMDTDNSPRTTRSKRKLIEQFDKCAVVLTKDPVIHKCCEAIVSTTQKANEGIESPEEPAKKKTRRSSNEPEMQGKRVLRSSTVQLSLSTGDNAELRTLDDESLRKSAEGPNSNGIKTSESQLLTHNVPKHQSPIKGKKPDQYDIVISYDDLDLFSEKEQIENETSCLVKQTDKTINDQSCCHPKESILCCMIEKYGVDTVRSHPKKIPDSTVKLVCEKIEQNIAIIIDLPVSETKNAMNRFVADLRKLNYKHFITGLMKYLTKPERKIELFGKVISPPAPAMTKAEQVLLYVISNLKTHWPSVDIVDAVLSNIEYILFKLNRTPEFDVIESTSHFYAILCRYFGAKSRLRLFILDAMYCIQFKSIPLIKQCLDVWMHIIPLAHMGIAKSPLVTCLVYLLHFYKCEDRYNRVQDIRNILSRKYFYEITDWNEKKILEMFKNSIKDLKDIPVERKMLRLALIILAKRQGPRWCQKNIIKNLLQPMIEKENVPENVKEFCVSMFGPLMKPYPVDMKVHCEIAMNQLTDILNNKPSPKMEEAAITSMMFINRHNQHHINQTLLSRKMKPISPDLEKALRDYVKAKPLKIWKKHLSKMSRS